MIIKMVCWMKSGVQIEESIEFIKEATIEDAEKVREEMNGLIRNAIRRNDSGTINFGFASFNISEIAAYRMTIEDVENKYDIHFQSLLQGRFAYELRKEAEQAGSGKEQGTGT